MNQSPAVQQCVAALGQLSQGISELLSAGPIDTPELTPRYVTVLVGHAIRQAEAIAEIAPHDRRLLQVSQLVRGLVVTHVTLAWLTQPNDKEERTRRAVRFRLDDLRMEKRRALYRQELGYDIGNDFWEWLHRTVENVWNREDTRNLQDVPTQLPNFREMCKEVNPTAYAVFQIGSSSAHSGSVAMGGYARETHDEFVIIGGRDPEPERVLRLVRAIASLQEIGELAVNELRLDRAAWEPTSQSAFETATDALNTI